ncbi:ATP-dependent DNA helicase RecQ [Vibrio zhanjiangensis]|uniref:ATP-dependent DNA helicase RecQ n=1 Tax=Vibrio zhanjiangensis TaxID=1046128 RepID=A0ABQ6EXI1_9VIBR|nr:RecQ family ATP-dependent DNA helicase [Vibrio zhanjiangensis]GLT17217.1 ATP-dependent DNA helicase RecQ [Vibrio zhanjiangensis]
MQTQEHHQTIYSNLKQHFGFEQLREGQYQVIDKVLSGKSCAAIFPTGSGKSLCYQLSALCLPNLTLVISPLLALMKDQLTFLRSKEIAAASLHSNQSKEEVQAIMTGVEKGETKILMVAVERMKNERFRHFLSQQAISLLVVDEAHCISEWGHNFRPDYLKLPQIQRQLSIPQVLLLTATATQAVLDDMSLKFNINKSDITVTGFYRPNLDISVLPCLAEDKEAVLLDTINQAPKLSTIVYVTQQNTAENIAKILATKGIEAAAYHAGLGNDERESVQNNFMSGKVDCIVATIAFGMGVDKADIRRIIHFDLPKSIENYAQEIGRAGRDGLTSYCTLLGNEQGVCILENYIYGDTPDYIEILSVIEQATCHSPQWEVIISRLSSESNIRQLPLKTLLVYLELHQVITTQYSYFAEYRFRFLIPQDEIVNRFSGERQAFTQALFGSATKAKIWCQVDFDHLWHSYKGERNRAISALDYFHQQGWIELESKLMTEVYRVNDLKISKEKIAQQLWELFKNKQRSDISRIHHMLALLKSEQCLSHGLANYFSDLNAPKQCGHCSVCRGETKAWPEPASTRMSVTKIGKWLRELDKVAPSALSNTLKAKFLCGITTPMFTKIKAKNITGFGQLSHSPYQQVLDEIAHQKLNSEKT